MGSKMAPKWLQKELQKGTPKITKKVPKMDPKMDQKMGPKWAQNALGFRQNQDLARSIRLFHASMGVFLLFFDNLFGQIKTSLETFVIPMRKRRMFRARS